MSIQLVARTLAGVSAGLVLTLGMGVASAQSDYHHSQGGTTTVSKTTNTNNVGVNNTTDQNATTGEAKVINKTDSHHGHDEIWASANSSSASATTGSASNGSTSNVGVNVSNTGGGAMGLSQVSSSGPVKTITTVTNTNDVTVCNTTTQNATSGDATVVGGSGGSATTGNASNSSNSTVTVSVSN